MLLDQIIKDKYLKIIFAALISYYFYTFIFDRFQAFSFVILGTFVFILAFIIRIDYAFYFLLFVRSIIDIMYSLEASGVKITQIIGASLVFLFLFYVVVVSKYNIFYLLGLRVNKIIGIFLVLSFPAVFLNESLREGVGYWFKLTQGFLFLNMTVLILINAKEDLYRKIITIICWCIISSLFIPLILYIHNVISGVAFVGTGGYKRYSTFEAHANLFVHHSLIVLAFCVLRYKNAIKNSHRLSWMIFIAIITSTILMSYARTIWLGLATMIFVWLILRKNTITASMLVVCFIVLVLVNPVVQDRFSDIGKVIFSDKTFFELDPLLGAGRIGVLQANLRHFMYESSIIEKLFGNGYGLRLAVSSGGKHMAEHNTYLIILIASGIFGLLAYLLYLITLIKESLMLLRRTKDTYYHSMAQLLISLTFAYMVMCLTDNMIWNLTFQYYFSVLVGFVVASNIILERERKRDGNK